MIRLSFWLVSPIVLSPLESVVTTGHSVPLNGHRVQTLDHDFHVNGIVPSVAFFVDVPDNFSNTFFRGIPFVTNKNKVTQPSSALRHATEMACLILKCMG